MNYFKKRAQIKRLRKHGIKIEARLIGVRNKQPEVQFTVGEEEVRRVLDTRSDYYESFVGKLIGVRYNPDNPDDCCAEAEFEKRGQQT